MFLIAYLSSIKTITYYYDQSFAHGESPANGISVTLKISNATTHTISHAGELTFVEEDTLQHQKMSVPREI